MIQPSMTHPANVVELLQALIRIPSVNPDGRPGTTETGEKASAEFVGAFLERCGARVEFQEVFPDRPNVLDTVGVLGMTIDPFCGEVRDGKIWGRGATDTKGTMAAMLWALWEMREQIAALDHEVWFVGFMSEETLQHGSKAFVKKYCTENPADTFALIGEPTGPSVIHTHKGTCRFHLSTRGVAVHSSAPETGVNAIYKMQEVIAWLREVLIPRFAELSHPVLGSPTLSVGTITGGSRTNVVPDFCEITVDVRTTPDLYPEGTASFGERVLSELRCVVPDIEGTYNESRSLWTDPSHPLIKVLEGLGKQCAGANWFCDAAIFSEVGVPAVAAGPGYAAQAHTKDEWLSVADLQEGLAFYRQFLQAL
jgi:acetylornithine deacetylase/succinyl-diaminopimelate desuccinylase-like protein